MLRPSNGVQSSDTAKRHQRHTSTPVSGHNSKVLAYTWGAKRAYQCDLHPHAILPSNTPLAWIMSSSAKAWPHSQEVAGSTCTKPRVLSRLLLLIVRWWCVSWGHGRPLT